ncbi:hypothetical protein BC835DRAFT_1309768 [Cytidiella melzeri]|nr:hypothetical protein BC835DRAFT_1309768 [Cytidiella melzeri]
MHFSTPLVLYFAIVTGAFQTVTVSAVPMFPHGNYPSPFGAHPPHAHFNGQLCANCHTPQPGLPGHHPQYTSGYAPTSPLQHTSGAQLQYAPHSAPYVAPQQGAAIPLSAIPLSAIGPQHYAQGPGVPQPYAPPPPAIPSPQSSYHSRPASAPYSQYGTPIGSRYTTAQPSYLTPSSRGASSSVEAPVIPPVIPKSNNDA